MIYQKPSGGPPPVQDQRNSSATILIAIFWPMTLVGAFLIGTFFGGISGAGNKKHSPPPPTFSGSVEQAGSVQKTTPNELLGYYKENPVAAREWLRANMVEVTGEIASISNGFGGTAEVTFMTSTTIFLPPDIKFTIEPAMVDKIMSLKVGQRVSITGKFQGTSFGDMEFRATNIAP